ncbi:hypothetical protein HPB52_012463 [Rhipicephalus sanguineus]|uniref:Uncharacterized protein n=1 Tax=Rhipicephalus sanguineus TaxID=34632 RepID=A0A9D4QAV4_RHISA|nr:hypothetical protein HPB52_012463 [Rhipicephalus sanguineus]
MQFEKAEPAVKIGSVLSPDIGTSPGTAGDCWSDEDCKSHCTIDRLDEEPAWRRSYRQKSQVGPCSVFSGSPMATTVTRSQRADGTSENHELDRDEASVDTDSADVRAVESADPAVQVRVKELEIEALKLQIELPKLKLQSHASNEVGRSDRCGLERYANQLRAVLPPMPVSDELVPAWFRSAENMLRSCDIPDEVQGAIIVSFLNENSRTLVANRAEDRVLSYKEVRDLVLHELKLTPEKYKHRLYACRKGGETWGQFATRLEILLDYYLRSREVSNVQELRALLISDRVKQLMREDMRTYVLQHETAEWLRPHDLAKLAQKYDESMSNRK